MGLISGMLMGMVVGIMLMVGWKHMTKYRSAKRVAKAVDMKLLGSLSRDELKRICGDNFPQWISFPVFEQVKWMNKILGKMWPFIADAASMVIKESVEPLLEDYRPPGISSLKFSKLFLGNVPPKIEGIRVQSLKKGQITMDIDLRWGGDPSIILSVVALVASLPIQLKDLRIFTVIRVIFQLSEEIPCISAVVVALLSDDTVNTIVSDMLEWPHRIVVPLGAVPIDTSDLELKPQGLIKVNVIKAISLKNMEFIGKSDPYVALHIRPMFKVKTKVVDNNLNPEWNEEFDLIVEDKETQFVTFKVFDEDVGQDKMLGIAKLPLIDLVSETMKELDLALLPSLDMLKFKDKKDRGSLKIKVFYHEFNKEEQMKAFEEENLILEQRKKMKEAGMIGSTMDALDGAAGLVGSGIGFVSTGVGAGFVNSGFGAVGSGLGKAGKFIGIGSSKKIVTSVPSSPAGNDGKKVN